MDYKLHREVTLVLTWKVGCNPNFFVLNHFVTFLSIGDILLRMSMKELLDCKHPTAWIEFEKGLIDEV